MPTFLFTDLEGSTKLLVTVGEGFAADLAAHNRLLTEAVAGHGGEVIGVEGDAVKAMFAAPADAIAAALDAQVALSRHQFAGGEMRVRMGVHTGAGEATEAGYVGLGLHVAARVCTAASGGQLLVSSETLAPIRPWPDGWEAHVHGPYALKDIAAPVTLVEVAGRGHPLSKVAPRAARPASTTLPSGPPVLVGRGDERAAIGAALARSAIVSVIGPGGVGKTTLALAAARDTVGAGRFLHWVDLAPVANDADAAAAVDDAVGTAVGDPAGPGGALVVLDNCEHVIAAAARIARQLAAAGATVLATSRAPLEVPGEHEIRVDPLHEDDALELFRAQAEARGVAVATDGADRANARRVVRAVDHLPLGVELAAARLRSMSLAELADRFLAGVDVLKRRGAAPGDRQRTLAAVIDWSWQLLADEERAILSRIAAFRAPFTGAAAAAVARVGEAVALDLLDELVAKSLVVFDRASGRYRLLDTVRSFALARLDDAGETMRAHLAWAAEVAARHQPLAPGGYATGAWWAGMRPVVPEVVGAVDWGLEQGGPDAYDAALLTLTVLPLWMTGAWLTHGRWVVEQAVHALDGARPAERSAALYTRAMLVRMTGDHAGARRDLEAALELARQAGASPHEMVILLELGQAAAAEDPSAGARYHWELVEIARRAGFAVMEALALNSLGRLAMLEGRFDEATSLFRQTIDLVASSGTESVFAASAYSDLSVIAHLRGDVAGAMDLVAEAIRRGSDSIGIRTRAAASLSAYLADAGRLAESRALAAWADREADAADDEQGRGDARSALARALTDLGDVAGARVVAEQALASLPPGSSGRVGVSLRAARAARLSGDPEAAVRLLEAAVQGCSAYDRLSLPGALAELGLGSLALGDLDLAAERLGRALDSAVAFGAPGLAALALEGLAGIAAGRGDAVAAARSLGMAEAVQPPALSIDRWRAADRRRVHESVVAALGEEEADRAIAAGRREAPALGASGRS